jgi:apolipoprotein N-acyltransferase
VKPSLVFARHLAATRTIRPDPALHAVVWPENAIDLPRGEVFEGSEQLRTIAAQARRLGVPFIVGVTEDGSGATFRNAQLVVHPDGSVTDRYEKKRRVPFGEWVPFRSVITALGAPTHMIPRDAEIGTTPGFLDVDDVRVGVAISWEIFFGGRANEGVAAGATVMLNPTNGSSYRTSLLQTQQLASSRLRAREQGRWLMQCAPTGFSAFVDPHGTVHDRTHITARAVITRTVELRTGRTLYSNTGNAPYIWVLLVLLALLAWRARGALSATRS